MEALNEKVKALLLNRIENLRWNYFEVNSGTMKIAANQQPDPTWFDHIKAAHSGWVWTGADIPPSTEIMQQLVNAVNKDPKLLFDVMGDIYKLRDIDNQSDAAEGTMGTLNQLNSEARNNTFLEKMDKGFRSNPKNLVVLAEGDSWFQFPRIAIGSLGIKDYVEDIGDYLGSRNDIAWYNLAYAGDWLSNMLYEGRYVTELDGIEPHVFLISGGGNDMVGGKRIKTFIKAAGATKPEVVSDLMKRLQAIRTKNPPPHKTYDPAKHARGLSWIQDSFIDFLNAIYIQYLALFVRLYKNTTKFTNLLSITQGYDYAIPSNDNAQWIEIGHGLVNKFVGNGKWLKYPMTEKGITRSDDQRAIVYTMIFEFNEMMLDFANSGNFPNVAHIDNRGIARDKDDWFDELHLESEVFKKVADKFYSCMDDYRSNKGKLTKNVF